MTCFAKYPSPMGELTLISDGSALTGLSLSPVSGLGPECPELPIFDRTRRWLDEYFAGAAPDPAGLPMAPEGTPFQKEVWAILLRIPEGQLTTYGTIARELAQSRGMKKMSAQAVGQAVGRNPINIIIPCHRVVGSDGTLTGYTGGLDKKIWLLRHEGHDY